ncbi:MAG: KTSC domain-containing protein, partial [Promethearchaeota archaeon]
SDFKDHGFCPYDILHKLQYRKSLESDLYNDDFSGLPTSIRIAQTVDAHLPQLKSDFPDMEESELLKIAYSEAKKVLDHSDFTSVKEEPIYFKIAIPNEELEAFEQDLKFAAELMNDYLDDNLYKIALFSLSDLKPAVKFRKDDLEESKLSFFKRIAEEDLKNVPPIFIDEDMQIWDGHHRYYTLKRLKYKEIYAIQLPERILKQINYNDYLDSWDFNDTSNINMTRFDTLLNRDLRKISDFIDDYTDDKAQQKFFAPDTGVSSTNVAEIGYDNGKLRVFFKNGWGYEYPVPASWYVEMLNAPSKGRYVWDTLRGRTPGRVIDNPNKITPGGVGGSIVPYFKIKGHRMPQEAMRKSVKGFLKAAKRGKAAAGGVPIQQISKPTFKQFSQFLKIAGDRKPKARIFRKIHRAVEKERPKEQKEQKPKSSRKKSITSGKSAAKAKKEKKEQATTSPPSNETLRLRLKELQKKLKQMTTSNAPEQAIKSVQRQIEAIKKQLQNSSDYSDDFVSDMKHFSGPITRAGDFEYPDGIKTKDFNNLQQIFSTQTHLPAFDSHNENQILGFAHNFTADPKSEYIFSEGYTFQDIENVASVPLTSESKLPVSIRFLDANEGTFSSKQDITDLIHLAISVNRTEVDRCSSAGGNPCFVRFQDKQDITDFIELEQEAHTMPKDKEEKEEEEPPKGDKKEESKDKKEKDSLDSKSDFDEEKFVKISKSDFEEIKQQLKESSELKTVVSDLIKENTERNLQVAAKELSDFKTKFEGKDKLYRIKSDFTKSANIEAMRTLDSALEEYSEDFDPTEDVFGSHDDFTTTLNQLGKKYGLIK